MEAAGRCGVVAPRVNMCVQTAAPSQHGASRPPFTLFIHVKNDEKVVPFHWGGDPRYKLTLPDTSSVWQRLLAKQICAVPPSCVHTARVRGGIFRKPRRPLIGRLCGPMRERAVQRVAWLRQRWACQTLVSAPPRRLSFGDGQMRELIRDQCLWEPGLCT